MLVQLAVQLRSMQLFAHSAHHFVDGSLFFADHDFLGETYKKLDNDYDEVVERIIGLYGEEQIDLHVVLAGVINRLHNVPTSSVKENKIFFDILLDMEHELCTLIEKICYSDGVTEGLKQLIGEIANSSEKRQYKLRQRTK